MRCLAPTFAFACLLVAGELRAQPAEEHVAVERIAAVQLDGQLDDDRDRLLRFLGLEVGRPFGQSDQSRVDQLLERLGYRQLLLDASAVGPGLLRLHLVVEPVRVVRNVVVRGNWPLFDDEIVRHLSLRTGQPLPADADLRQRLLDEAEAVRKYLANEGYFDAHARIEPHVALVGALRRARPEWIDLKVSIDLGRSYKLGSVEPIYDRPDGARHMSPEEVRDLFNHWLRFKISRMRDDARRAEKILRDRDFPGARVTPDLDFARDVDRRTHRVHLRVHITLRRKIAVRFVGNHATSDSELRAHLTIFSSGAYDEIELQESARALEQEAQRRGYFDAHVEVRRALRRPPPGKEGAGQEEVEEVTFSIDEGPELKVQRVDLISTSGRPLWVDQAELKEKAEIETKPFPRLGSIGLGEGGYATQQQLEQDVERLLAFYRAHGFPDIKVHSEVVRQKDDGGERGLAVRFLIDEGRHEVVDHVEVEFVGAHGRSELDIIKAIDLGAEQSFTIDAVTRDIGRIEALYDRSGRPFRKVEVTQSSWNAGHDRVTLRYLITEGAEVRFGPIFIRGNFKTRARTILRDLPFHSGDLYDLSQIEAAERYLQTHLIFNSARVQVELDPGSAVAPILVTVQERYLEAYGSLTLAIGGASDRRPDWLYAAVGYLWPNVLGFGSQLELKADVAFLAAILGDPITMGASLSYRDLRIFGPGWRFDLTGFIRREVTNRFGVIDSYGGSMGFTRNLTPALRLFGRYDAYLAAINVGFIRLDGSNSANSTQERTFITKLVFGLVWDRRVGADGTLNPLAPVKGWLFSGGTEVAHANWVTPDNFLSFSGQLLGLLPVRVRNTGFTFIGNLRYNHGLPLNPGQSALPLVERFYGGGDTATRGWDTDTLKTEIIRTGVSPLGNDAGFRVVPQGGNIRFLNTLELQFPIARNFLGLPLQWTGALFWDVGVITNSLAQLARSDLKHSVGISLLRLITPVGPLSIEYAYPLTMTLAEERWKTAPWYSHYPGRIHFNWGIPLSRL